MYDTALLLGESGCEITMRNRLLVLVGVMLTCAAVALSGGGRAQEVMLEISHRARGLYPGEVVIVGVQTSASPVTVRATAFGHSIRFFPNETDGIWRGLIGIDLTTEPGEYPVAVRVTTLEGETVRRTYVLAVSPKEFPTRHLTVSPSFVNPPPEVLDRLQRESRQVADIFRISSADRQWSGPFLAPVPGQSTSSFGRRSVFNGESRSPHSGADFRATEGTHIEAPNAGTVVLADNQYFSGNVVIIDHGWGLYSYFAHLSAIDVTEGDTVTLGQVVGKVGATGRVTGPHLHWTVRLNEARVDPLSLMELFSN
jgi:murein DD-endopeptidase MepM/ murein hydrolase activator NlpD